MMDRMMDDRMMDRSHRMMDDRMGSLVVRTGSHRMMDDRMGPSHDGSHGSHDDDGSHDG